MRRAPLALMALAAGSLVLPGVLLPGRAAAAAAAPQRPAAVSQPGCIIPVSISCPSPSPTPAPTPSASGSADPAPAPSTSPGPSPSPTGSRSAAPAPSPSGTSTASPSPSPSNSAKAASVKAATPSGLMVSAAQFALSTGSAALLGASYEGVAQVPTANGGTVPMMKFTMSSLTLNGTPTLTVTQRGITATTSGSSMTFTGNVVLYATQLSGDLGPLPVTLTPSSPLVGRERDFLTVGRV